MLKIAPAMGTPAQLEVFLKDGRRFFREKNHVIGSPAEPLTLAQFSFVPPKGADLIKP